MNLCAIILAAGQGTRMKSSLPKVLHPVIGRPMIGHAVQKARDAGASRVLVILGHGREQVEAYLRKEEPGDDLEIVIQEEQLGTAHAVRQTQPALANFEGRALILTGDAPNLRPETLQAFIQKGVEANTAMAFMSCHVPNPKGYGRIVRDEHGQVLFNVEHKDATPEQEAITEINAGFYLVDNAFLWKYLGQVNTQNAQSEYFLPDLIALAKKDGGVTCFCVENGAELEGVNTRLQLSQAEAFARKARNEALMLSGVTMIDPSSTYIDARAEVEPDVVLDPNVSIKGRSKVSSGCVIQQGCVIENSTLETGVLLKPYSHLESSLVRAEAQVGPFAHLRPASDIGEQAKVGNFVEIKKSTLGKGSKASHLSYIGDATIGDACNIGAGTITCNYDGQNKHKTIMGDGVFIGSNTALVAPLELEDNAYVGAGSTITNRVPSGALAVARGRQRNLEGWVDRKKKRS